MLYWMKGVYEKFLIWQRRRRLRKLHVKAIRVGGAKREE